eukprot:4841470-Prymnesium_polylepis.2
MRACCRTHAAHDSTTTSSTVTNTSGRSSQCRRVSSPMLSPRHARYNPSDCAARAPHESLGALLRTRSAKARADDNTRARTTGRALT